MKDSDAKFIKKMQALGKKFKTEIKADNLEPEVEELAKEFSLVFARLQPGHPPITAVWKPNEAQREFLQLATEEFNGIANSFGITSYFHSQIRGEGFKCDSACCICPLAFLRKTLNQCPPERCQEFLGVLRHTYKRYIAGLTTYVLPPPDAPQIIPASSPMDDDNSTSKDW